MVFSLGEFNLFFFFFFFLGGGGGGGGGVRIVIEEAGNSAYILTADDLKLLFGNPLIL